MTFSSPDPFTTRPTLRGHFGMSASTHWVASASAQAVLERGGNAFDAAVAAGFVLHVVEPHLNGPGGDLTAVFATATDPTPRVLIGQGPAPAGATIEHLRAEGLDLVPGAGGLAAAVPGAVDAWLLLLSDHGTWELADVLAFAIGYAERGPPAPRAGHGAPSRPSPTSSATTGPPPPTAWLPDGEVPQPGDLCPNRQYAATLRRLVEAGQDASTREERIDAARRAWGEGFVAEAIEAFVATPHRHSSGTDHAGVITAADLAGVPGVVRAGGHPRLPRRHRGEDRRRGARGRCCCRRWRSSRGSSRDERRPLDRRRRPPGAGGAQARDGRPRRLVRRPRPGR